MRPSIVKRTQSPMEGLGTPPWRPSLSAHFTEQGQAPRFDGDWPDFRIVKCCCRHTFDASCSSHMGRASTGGFTSSRESPVPRLILNR